MAQYGELMTAIVQKQMSLVGRTVALKTARQVLGIEVSDAGIVHGHASKSTLELLLKEYESLSGEHAFALAKDAIKPILDGTEDLPDKLKEEIPLKE
ncbi:hypothetical protein ACFLQI_03500 [Candidatus Undinarchaeota archaeon]